MGNFNLENYIPVNERLTLFYKDFPNGRVVTEVVQHELETGFVMFKASVYRDREDAEPSATGHAYEMQTQGYVNKTSYIENCETSSVGRALALLGYEIQKGIASREEMQKVQRQAETKPPTQKPNGNNLKTAIDLKPYHVRINDRLEDIRKLGVEPEKVDFSRYDEKQLIEYGTSLKEQIETIKSRL